MSAPRRAIEYRRTDRGRRGQIDYSDMDRVCVCGHTLGIHAAAGDRACFAYDLADEACEAQCRLGLPEVPLDCGCMKFKPLRKRK